MQLTHGRGGVRVLGRELVGVEHPERAAEPTQLGGVTRQDVGTAQPPQLQPVLDGAQEPVGGREAGGVAPPDVAAAGQPVDRAEGGASVQLRVGAAVHQLEQLDGELDVAQPAGAELDVPLTATTGDRPPRACASP